MKNVLFVVLGLGLGMYGIVSCTQKVASRPNFIFKTAVTPGVIAKFKGKDIARETLYQGIENDIYEAQMKVYDIKMSKLKAHILEVLVADLAKAAGLGNDQFLDQVIAKGVEVTPKDIDEFIKKRGVPKSQITENFKKRVKNFLIRQKKEKAIEKWLAEQTHKHPVEVYIKKPVQPVFDIRTEGSPFMGGTDAKVTVVEFSDFQCGFCKEGAHRLKQLKDKYGNKIKIVFKNFPLPIHNYAKLAAQAGLCAHDQNSSFFWKLHDKMFADQKNLDKQNILSMAKESGVEMAKFTDCLEKGKNRDRVAMDIKDGEKIGVRSTPTFFINGKVVAGIRSLDFFVEQIEEELKKAL